MTGRDEQKAAITAFIDEARAVDLETVYAVAGGEIGVLTRRSGGEYVGPCPACRDGKDRFSINFDAGVWHCRQCDGGKGGDGIALIAQVNGFDLNRRHGLLAACAEILGRAPPDGAELESEAERQARRERLDARRAQAAAKRKKQDAYGEKRRQHDISQGRGFWLNAGDGAGTIVEDYCRLRMKAESLPPGLWDNLRCAPRHTYYDGKDARGHDIEIHCGPAMIAPLVAPVGAEAGRVTGSHQTWIDLARPPKFRPDLRDDAGEPRVTKKMRGHKRGSVIPLLGDLSAVRWLVGEGIETTGRIAALDGWREDTFYAAAGDIGNMAGPADAKSNFDHPTIVKPDKNGRPRPVKVAGPVPKPGSEADCFQLPAHVAFLILLADGDSETVFTLSAMARAEARLARPGLDIAVWWPPVGTDWAEIGG